jgi:hypothetical protein
MLDTFATDLQTALGLLFTPLGILSVALVAANVALARGRKKSLRVLAASLCPSCGQVFGHPAAVQTSQEREAQWAAQQRAHPNVKHRRAPVWPITCARCGHLSNFNFQRNEVQAERTHKA